MAFISYAQNNEDVLLNRVFGGQQVGFYVDVGAFHPVEGSVTKAFYDRGWSGINLEPGSIFDVLAAARPRDVNLRMAVLDRKGEVAFYEDPADGGMSHVLDTGEPGGPRRVPCDTLEAIIADHGKGRPINFIKVDAEGAEAAIVRSTDWRRLRPRVLVFEATLPWSSMLANGEWEPGLLAAGYVRAYFDGINCFYVPEEEWPLLSQHFAVPVNVLDGVIPHGGAFDALRAEADRLREAHNLAAHDASTFLAERDYARAARDRLQGQAAHDATTFLAERDGARAARDRFQGQAAQVRAERDEARASLEQMRGQAAEIAAELKGVILDRTLIGAELEKVFADRDALYAEAMSARAAAAAASPPPAVPMRRSPWLRRAARAGYGLVRPIAKPVAWRLRSFLLGPTAIQIGSVQAQLRQLEAVAGAAMPASPAAPAQTDLDTLLAEFRQIVASASASAAATAAAATAAPAELRGLAKAMEETLLTLAMTAERPAATTAVAASPGPKVALRLPGGRRSDIAVGAADLSLGAALIASDGDWEPQVRCYLESIVKPDWACLDIGANLGAHTLSLASLATAGQVVAFEADPANFALLTHNIGALPPPHGRITPVQLALWDSPGMLTIGGADELAGCSFVSAGATDAARTEDRLRMVVDRNAIAGTSLNLRLSEVAAMRLDDWIAQQGLTRLDIIKLDVEGAEANVIRGADDTIRRLRPILLVEYNPPCAAAYFDQPADALYRELATRFAAIHVLEDDGRLSLIGGWDELAARLALGKGYEDLVCIPAPV